MTPHLLDVNVLLALFDSKHIHYEAANDWLFAVSSSGWATCPITENGFIRISSSPSYPNRPGDASHVVQRLNRFCQHPHHLFWPADVTLSEIVNPGQVFVHSHITDLYLLGLAVRHGGKLATFDRRIPSGLVVGGDNALTIIPM